MQDRKSQKRITESNVQNNISGKLLNVINLRLVIKH